jgi:hypothetical protein
MELDIVLLSEISQIHKDKYHMFFSCGGTFWRWDPVELRRAKGEGSGLGEYDWSIL